MSHAFAKDSRACAACVSWGGARTLSADNTLVEVTRYAVEGECRTAASEDYRRVTRSYHTCGRWAALPLLKAHGARPIRGAVATGGLTGAQPLAKVGGETAALAAPVAVDEPRARTSVIAIERTPQAAQAVYGHWHRLKRDRAFPAAGDISIPEVREAVPRLCLLVPAGDDFIYRTCGRAILRRLGPEARLGALTACHTADVAARIRADASTCLASGEPLAQIVADDPSAGGARYVELLLPLADETGKAACILVYRHLPGG